MKQIRDVPIVCGKNHRSGTDGFVGVKSPYSNEPFIILLFFFVILLHGFTCSCECFVCDFLSCVERVVTV